MPRDQCVYIVDDDEAVRESLSAGQGYPRNRQRH
jgi:FixJ family two-component response regulator